MRKYKNTFDYIISGLNTEANKLRQDIAIIGNNMGIYDMAGKNWGQIAIEESEVNECNAFPWWTRKIQFMSKYRFSVAMESTIYPFHVTEKICQSIFTYTLPIYCGRGSSIYETFPEDSFFDLPQYVTLYDVYLFINNIPYGEYVERMNRCIDVYNNQVSMLSNQAVSRLEEVLDRVKTRLDTNKKPKQ